ncbi:MAG: hypothetical protein K2X93_23800 [Candidatus Obscuribacterales bacterium]|nr:hypothetical protein [Candidatus Obscuribacterales bacterium]
MAREVGTEGKLGGQADVQGVSGTWKDLTDSVNYMAGNTGGIRVPGTASLCGGLGIFRRLVWLPIGKALHIA